MVFKSQGKRKIISLHLKSPDLWCSEFIRFLSWLRELLKTDSKKKKKKQECIASCHGKIYRHMYLALGTAWLQLHIMSPGSSSSLLPLNWVHFETPGGTQMGAAPPRQTHTNTLPNQRGAKQNCQQMSQPIILVPTEQLTPSPNLSLWPKECDILLVQTIQTTRMVLGEGCLKGDMMLQKREEKMTV